jgi:hypothetical protein
MRVGKHRPNQPFAGKRRPHREAGGEARKREREHRPIELRLALAPDRLEYHRRARRSPLLDDAFFVR